MQAQSRADAMAAPLITDTRHFLAGACYWKAAIMTIALVILAILLITEPGKAARFKSGAELAFSRARQLLHEADKENRNVRPLPLSPSETLAEAS
jgi:hypothetical protein